jgi:hypothetical protein
MKTKVFFFSAIVTLLLATGCSMHVIQGDGNLVTEQVAIGDYSEIAVSGGSFGFYLPTSGFVTIAGNNGG